MQGKCIIRTVALIGNSAKLFELVGNVHALLEQVRISG